jgi:hypothetical protein
MPEGLQSAIMADLTSIGAALGSLRTLWDIARNTQDAHLAMKISAELGNIQGQLIDVQQQALSVQEENQKLRTEIEKLKTTTLHHGVTWRKRPDGTEDGPFCPVCIAHGRDMRLTPIPRVDQARDFWMLYCTEGHRPAKGMEPAPGPFYDVPKELVPENYFWMRPGPKV